MKIMVTGANGFVGTHLLNVLREHKVSVIALDKVISNRLEHCGEIKTVQCDLDEIGRLPSIIDDRDIDCCIHLAWQGANGGARSDTEMQLCNVSRTINLCKVLPKLCVKRFVGIGTLAEKDAGHYIPMDGATPNGTACYGVAKMTAQYMSKIISTQLGIEHVWCQLSNLYGVGDTTNNFINFACKLMLIGQRASFTAGEQMYDFVYISDIAKGIYLAAKNGRSNTTYYIGSGNQRPLKWFIGKIRDSIDPSIQLHLGEVPFNGVCLPDEEFDCSKLIRDTGYQADVSFENGIQKTVAWLRTQEEIQNGKN